MTDARTHGVEFANAWVMTVLGLGCRVAALVMACTAHQVAVVHHRG